ncbi:hypothetical protein MAR_022336 [Mya arenaria]|uniref:Mitochondria-eating protein C-terminal domain-containing protein n=1 Tax=Mya arenaria TaxID=6604 RepID=A0ABY7DPF7_MYAAR|nr:hypothetical protein MAR_022336 [Mya arenaria]
MADNIDIVADVLKRLGRNQNISKNEIERAKESYSKTIAELKHFKDSYSTAMSNTSVHGEKPSEHPGDGQRNGKKQDIHALMERNAKMREELDTSKRKIQELLTRLSSLAGQKLSDSNPEITDLSDPNRPTVLKVDQFCTKAQAYLLEKLQTYIIDDIVNPTLPHPDGKGFVIFQQMHVPSIKKKCQVKASTELDKFVSKCVELLWLMEVQDPPMQLIWAEQGHRVDKDRFTFYTKRGEVVQQSIWPAVLLHKDGPLMSKGISEKMSNTTIDILADLLKRLSKKDSRIKITDEEAAMATKCYNGLIGDLKKYRDQYYESVKEGTDSQFSKNEAKASGGRGFEDEIENLKEELKKKDEEIARLQRRPGPKSSEVAVDKNRELQQKLQQKERTIQELRTRLSGIAGQKLSEGNPDITDLSDPYRPTILDVNKFCIEAERDQFVFLKESALREILQPTVKYQKESHSSPNTEEMSTLEENAANIHLKELRKALAVLSGQGYLKIFAKLQTDTIKRKTNLKKLPDGINTFIESSLKSIWLMKVQDPPVVLKWVDPGTKVQTDKFSFYTKKGKTVAQCVWPAVLLHEDGPLMSKGIVQGRGD